MYKILTTTTTILASVLTAHLSLAQSGSETLEELCVRFPDNSRCEGIESPVSLETRGGEEYSCHFEFQTSALEPLSKCKIEFTSEGIVVYQEQGEKLDLLDDERTTSEIEISGDRIFATNYQIWNKIDRWQLGFVSQPESGQPAQSNFLTVIVDEEKVEAFAPQAKALEANNPEILEPAIGQSADTQANIEQLLGTGECEYCDLGGADLSGAELEEVNLEGAYLVGANLQGANLEGANLSGTNLTFANLVEVSAIETDLEAANLQGANLEQANLEQARLSAPALLKQANLTGAILIDADLRGANFNLANLQQADLSGANLDQTDVEIDDIPGNYSAGEQFLDTNSPLLALAIGTSKGIDFPTDFLGANLEGANFSNTSLKKVIFEGANLTNVDFTESNLDSEELEIQSGVQLCGVILPDGATSDRDCQ